MMTQLFLLRENGKKTRANYGKLFTKLFTKLFSNLFFVFIQLFVAKCHISTIILSYPLQVEDI